jgi:predicted TIM-barrel fold metal-dependent hydrolase
MDKLAFFDCHCSIGRLGHPILLDIPDAAGLKREMAAAGVERALVSHTIARHGDPGLGNARLMEEIAGDASLVPAWFLLPHHTGEMPPPPRLLEAMKAAGVMAARLDPGRARQSFSLAEWCAGDLLAALESVRLPLLLDADIVGWDEVHDLLRRYPRLPLVMANCTYRFNRYLYPLFERHPNLHVEISRFLGAGSIEDVVRRFGAGRLLFGTHMPFYTGTAAAARLAYAEIERSDKEAIAAGNLDRIIGEAWT